MKKLFLAPLLANADGEFQTVMLAAAYAVGCCFLYPLWRSESWWGLVAAVAPIHSIIFWWITNARKDGRFIGAPIALVLGACVAIGSEGDAQWVVGLVTLFIVGAICFSGKNDKSSLL